MVSIKYDEVKPTTFSDLNIGDYFISDGALYVKSFYISTYFGVKLATGIRYEFEDSDQITIVDVEINVKRAAR